MMDKRLFTFLAMVVLIPSLFINFTTGWNVESRWALSKAIARKGVTHIEDYVEHSRDVTESRGHLYSAKAPGLSLMCVPILWSLDRLYPVYTLRAETIKRYICRIITVGLPFMGIGFLIWSFPSPLAPLIATCTVLGTPLLPYASVLYGHVIAAFLLFIAWRSMNRSMRGILIAGLFCGLSVLVEYPAIFGVLVIAAVGFYRSRRQIWRFIIGGIPAAFALMAYNYRSFGTVFATGYSSFSDPEFQAVVETGFFGFGLPSVRTMASILFGPYRGLFITAPWLILWFAALPSVFRATKDRIVFVIMPILYVLVFSGFTMWWGGASCCMRHLIVTIPFMASLIIYLRKSFVIPLMIFGIGSTIIQLSFLIVEPETPENFVFPLINQAIPWFLGSRIRPMVIDVVGLPVFARVVVVFVAACIAWSLAADNYRRRRVVRGEAL